MRRAACPGSFDPITNGHLDVIARVSRIFDDVVVLVSVNKSKRTMFDLAERMHLISECTADLPNVRVDSVSGLLVDYCREHQVHTAVKGLRAVTDFDYELQMAQMNFELAAVETLFMPTNPRNSFLSSSLVKEVATFGGDVSHLIPPVVHKALLARIADTAGDR